MGFKVSEVQILSPRPIIDINNGLALKLNCCFFSEAFCNIYFCRKKDVWIGLFHPLGETALPALWMRNPFKMRRLGLFNRDL